MTSTTVSAADTDDAATVLPWWAAAAMAVMSGCLLALSYSLQPLWWAAWLAPAPVLAAAVASPPRRAMLLGAIAGLIAGSMTFSYYLEVAGTPVTIGIMAAHTVFWAGAIRLAARAAVGLRSSLAVFALPAFTAGLETVVAAYSPHGTAGSLGYSQMDVLPLIQVAAFGGLPAIVFVVLSGGAGLGLFIGRLMGAPLPWRQVGGAALAVMALVASALAFGTFELRQNDNGPTVAVRLISTDRFARTADWADVWAAYEPAAEAAATPGSVVVLPEKLALLSGEAAHAAALDVAAVAKKMRATIAWGLEVQEAPGQFANRAFVANPDGQISTYDKQHPVPILEARDRPGRSLLIGDIAGARTGVAICKDMHFASLGSDYGRGGARLMLVPAWDFDRDAWLSDRLTALRGVESGFAIARATREGISSVSDRHGRILAEAMSTQGMTVVRAAVTLSAAAGRTLYDQIGDAFGWLCLAAAAAFVFANIFTRRSRV